MNTPKTLYRPGFEPLNEHWLAVWKRKPPWGWAPIIGKGEKWGIFWKDRQSNDYNEFFDRFEFQPSVGVAYSLVRTHLQANPFWKKSMQGKQFHFARMDCPIEIPDPNPQKPPEDNANTRAYLGKFGFVGSVEQLQEKITVRLQRDKKLAREVIGGRFYPMRADISLEVPVERG
jgi:hypothetical protein